MSKHTKLELLDKLAIAKKAIRVGLNIHATIRIWKEVQEIALGLLDEETLNEATNVVETLEARLK